MQELLLEKGKNEVSIFKKIQKYIKPLGKDVVITKGKYSLCKQKNFIDNISELPKDTTITFADGSTCYKCGNRQERD